jgi:hypothetical protein
MIRLSLLLAAAATVAATVAVQSQAEARDGCGRGWYFNGYRCVPSRGSYYGPRRYDPGSYYAPNFRGNVVRPVRGANGTMSCSNPNYTWQDGACKPYRGRRW